MADNIVTVNDTEDHVIYTDLKMGTVFTFVNGTPAQCQSHYLKLDVSHACIETGAFIKFFNSPHEFRHLKCKVVKSITITRK